jgi:membrane protease YdiL (CAAX protease family)
LLSRKSVGCQEATPRGQEDKEGELLPMPAPNTANSTPETAPRPASARGNPLAHYPLVSFFVLAYALSWLAWSPWFLSEAGTGLLPFDGGRFSTILNIAALVLGPTLSALVVTAASEGRGGVRRLLGRIVLWRVGFRWYLFVLVGTPAIVVLSTLAMPGALASFQAEAVPRVLFLYVVAGLFFLFAGGPFFEEIGWRGFALPRLQAVYGPLVGSLVLGVLWGLWHLPLFLIPSWDTPHGSVLDVALFIVLALALTVLLTWVFNNTKGSVLAVILAHGSLNVSAVAMYDLFPAPSVTEGIANVAVGFGLAAVAVVVLTRGRLGYRIHPQNENRGST